MDAKQKRIEKTKKFFGKRRKKVQIDFDSEERRDFLTGFQKRKADRKKRAKEELKIKFREEKLRLKHKRKENLDKLMESQRTAPEVQTILSENTVTYELPKQMVSITTFDAKEVSGSLGLSLGHNDIKTNQKSIKKQKK